MTRRQILTELQLAALFDPPTDQRDLVRHYTLNAGDLAMIQRCRGDQNRLGYALMLCYLRHPGRPLKTNEQPPFALVSFVAGQIDALPEAIDEYLTPDRNRQRHAIELQDKLGLQPFNTRAATELMAWLQPHAIENDRLAYMAGLVMEECRRRRMIVPLPGVLERLCVEARLQARREVHRRLSEGLSADHRRQLDKLTQRRPGTTQSLLTWIRQMPEAAKPMAMLGLIDRLKTVRLANIDVARGHRVHQARLAQLVREANRSTVQNVAGFEGSVRYFV